MHKRWAITREGLYYYDGFFKSEFGSRPLLFPTRAEAREYIDREWGYIRHRADLRQPPHNWRMPKAVQVEVILKEVVK